MKTTTNSFSVSRLTDSDLRNLSFAVAEEMSKRERKREAERQKWIDGYYFAFLNHPNASAVQVGETTVVAFWSRSLGLRMGTATPVHGDVFDHDIGIAVAYAKAVGDKVPSYI